MKINRKGYRNVIIGFGLFLIVYVLFDVNINFKKDIWFLFITLTIALFMKYYALLFKDVKFDFTETLTIFVYLSYGMSAAVIFEALYELLSSLINFIYRNEKLDLKKIHFLFYNTSMFAIIIFIAGTISKAILDIFNLSFITNLVFLSILVEGLFLLFNLFFLFLDLLFDGSEYQISDILDKDILISNFVIAVTLSLSLYFINYSIGRIGTLLIFLILIMLSYSFYLYKRIEFKNAVIKNILIISEDLIKYGDIKEKCNYFLMKLKEIIPYDVAAIYFFDYDTDELAMPISYYIPQELDIKELKLNIKSGQTIKMVLQKRIYISKNVKNDKNVLISGELAKWSEVAVLLPIIVDDKVRGLIFLAGKMKLSNLLLQDVQDPLDILSKQISLALSNYKSFIHIKEEAELDPLTGLYNRKVLNREIEGRIKQNTEFSIVIFDIDNFKQINDTYGHLVGDKVLQIFAKIVKGQIRETDIACRFGGEEIIIILNKMNKQQAYIVAERIRKKVEEYKFEINDFNVKLTVSGGVASFPEDAKTMKELILCADSILYSECKEKGKNKIAIFNGWGIKGEVSI